MIGGKNQYALEIVLCLSESSFEFPLAKPRISERIGISKDYIEQLAKSLVAAGLIKSKRGLKGGFYLAKPVSEISVQDVIEAQGGKVFVGGARKPLKPRRVWQEAESLLESYFSNITLEELLDK